MSGTALSALARLAERRFPRFFEAAALDPGATLPPASNGNGAGAGLRRLREPDRTDPLTGLHNRAGLTEATERAVPA